eukprot:957242-Pelagomonas_calceolata.AAC.2
MQGFYHRVQEAEAAKEEGGSRVSMPGPLARSLVCLHFAVRLGDLTTQQIKERERQQRIANRAEVRSSGSQMLYHLLSFDKKRSKLKEELGLDDNWGDSSSEPDSDVGQQGGSCAGDEGAGGTGKPAEEKDGKVVVYQQQGLMTTVTTMPIEDDPFHQSRALKTASG